jgi:hypothetical protein
MMPCSPLKVSGHFGGMSVDFQQTTQRYIPEDRTLYNHLCENLKSYLELIKLQIDCVHRPPIEKHCYERLTFIERLRLLKVIVFWDMTLYSLEDTS